MHVLDLIPFTKGLCPQLTVLEILVFLTLQQVFCYFNWLAHITTTEATESPCPLPALLRLQHGQNLNFFFVTQGSFLEIETTVVYMIELT